MGLLLSQDVLSQIQRPINHCDVCGHEWLPSEGVAYSHCTSGKCRSRKWNKDAVFIPANPAMYEDVIAAKDASEVARGIRKPGTKKVGMVKIVTDDARQPAKATIVVHTGRPDHDVKECRVYRCGACAAAKG